MASIDTPALVIGASSAGLAAARCLAELGVQATVVEAQNGVGKTWRGAYERLHLHTPRSKSALPYMPMPAAYPTYPSRGQVIEYLEAYAAALPHAPLFGRRAITLSADSKRWRVETTVETIFADAVVVATGNARVPVEPSLPGLDQFAGTVVHSSMYKSGAPFSGQRVLVVGFGNSACEIAIDLHEHGARPTLSVRGPVNVVPRDVFGFIPALSLGVIQGILPTAIADALNEPIVRLHVGDITRLGLEKLPYGAVTQIREHGRVPVLDIGTLALIRAGSIAVRPGVQQFEVNGATFVDGRSDAYDAVIFATGYRPDLRELLAGVGGVVDAEGAPLVSGDATARSGLYFCGFSVAAGGMLREAGIEAHRIAGLIAATTQARR